MIKNVNGININGSPGGTMSQSISTPVSNPFGVYSYTDTSVDPVDTYYVIGKSAFDKQWLDRGCILNLRANLTQTISLGWTYSIGIFWATQSTTTTFNASSLPSGMVRLSSYVTTGTSTHVPVTRGIYISGTTSFSVLSPTLNASTDIGDATGGSRSSVTISGGDGYFLVAVYKNYFGDPGRLSDSIRFHYMLLEPIYKGVNIGSGYQNWSRLIVGRNDVAVSGRASVGFLQGGGSHTGDTVETIIGSIEATDFVADGDFFRFETRCYKTGSANIYTIRYYYNTSNTLTGATLLATRGIGASNLYHRYSRGIYVYKADGTGSGTELLNVSSGGYSSEYAGSSSEPYQVSNVAIDWTVTCYLLCAVTLGSAADTVNCEYLSVNTY